jgi:hypothetical protein
MKSILTKLVIVSIGSIDTVNQQREDKKQVLRLKEPAYIHPTNPAKNGKDNNYEVEIWNTGIPKFSLKERFREGQEVNVEFWINGALKTHREGLKCYTQLTLASIAPTM